MNARKQLVASGAVVAGASILTLGITIGQITSPIHAANAGGKSASTATASVYNKHRCPQTGAGRTVRCIVMPGGKVYAVNRVGFQITDTRSLTNPGTPLLITDFTGAPMLSVDWTGLYSFGAPGFPGGLVCTTKVLAKSTCLLPNSGGVEFFGPVGTTPITITYSDAAQFKAMLRWFKRTHRK